MPGYGGGDRNVIAVEDGEFIMNKDAVRHWGLAFMEAVNRSDMMTKKQFSTGGFVAPSYDYVTRALYAGTKRIRGFSDGGLVTSSNSGDIMQAIERLGGIVTDLIETTGGQSDSLQSGIESFAQTINRAGQMLNGVAKRMDTSAGKLESTLNTPFHVDVEVDANGKGSAKAGSWGG